MSWLSRFTGENWVALATFSLGSLAVSDFWRPFLSVEHALSVAGVSMWVVGVIHFVQKLAGKQA